MKGSHCDILYFITNDKLKINQNNAKEDVRQKNMNLNDVIKEMSNNKQRWPSPSHQCTNLLV